MRTERSMSPRPDTPTGLAESQTEIHWGQALEEHAPWIRTVIRSRLNEPQAVDDVMQEVALGVLKSTHRPTDPSKVAPWLYRVAIKQCLMYRRSAGRRRKLVDRFAVTVPQTTSQEKGDPLPSSGDGGEGLVRGRAHAGDLLRTTDGRRKLGRRRTDDDGRRRRRRGRREKGSGRGGSRLST